MHIVEMINDIFGGPQYPDYDGDDYYYGNWLKLKKNLKKNSVLEF